MDFIGRKRELAFLEKCYASQKAQLIVLYGRRRVGKTETLRRFSQDKPCVFFSCTQETDASLLAGFSRRLISHYGRARQLISAFPSWQTAFEAIPKLDMPGRKLVIIDEFPYACAANNALPSILQNAWDGILQREDVMVVLCGSSRSFMEDRLLGAKNPLYGRATGIWKMEPLGYDEASLFFPDYTPQEKLEAYGIVGGVPHYLRQFDPRASITENVKASILSQGSALHNEIEFLMRQELREPAVYNTVLAAVAAGETNLNGISQKALVDVRVTSTYLGRLSDLGILEREYTVTAGEQERTKPHRGIWRVCDNYFKFWYAAVRPSLSELDAGDVEGVWSYVIEPQLDSLLSEGFERVCRQWVRRQNMLANLPFRYERMGRWWQGSDEVDIAALGADHAHLLGECKFWKTEVGPGVLDNLRRKEERFFPQGPGWLWLFSKNGYADDGAWAADGQVRLVMPEELER